MLDKSRLCADSPHRASCLTCWTTLLSVPHMGTLSTFVSALAGPGHWRAVGPDNQMSR